MVNKVNKNPMLVCMVNAVPTYRGSLSSLTAVLNCALSATTAKPQIRHRIVRMMGELKKNPAIRKKILPLDRI